jgi:hypothetical protein
LRWRGKKGDEYFTKEKKSLKNLLFIIPAAIRGKIDFPPFNLLLPPPHHFMLLPQNLFFVFDIVDFHLSKRETQVIWKMFIEGKSTV